MPSKELINTASILADLLQGDMGVYDKYLKNTDQKKIKIALDYILNNESLSQSQKVALLTETWRVNYREKPPTPEEFLSEKYLGRMSDSIYPRTRKWFLDFYSDDHPEYRNAVLFPFIGAGKEGRNDQLIMTPTGYTTHGEVKVGQEVCMPDGTISKVTHVFPQGYKNDLYEFVFSDGRKVIVGSQHLWKASNNCNAIYWDKEHKKYATKIPTRIWKTVTTQDIIDDYSRNPKARWCIPITKAVNHTENKHIIPPYTLGALIGDGYLCSNKGVSLVGDDKEVFDRVISELPPNVIAKYHNTEKRSINYCLYFGKRNAKIYTDAIKNLGLDIKGEFKFIPKEYLYDSIENRISLLQGLLDTDGTSDIQRGKVSFSTSSESLKNNIIELVRGLGGLSSYGVRDRGMYRGRKYKKEYKVSIQFPQNNFPLFTIKRKQKRVEDNLSRPRKRRNTQSLFISSINKAEGGYATCIMVDHPEHLYLTNDYIVTHNSTLSVLMNLYETVHLALMRNPKKYFGLSPSSILAFVLASYNLKKASEVLLEPFMNIIESSDFFERCRTKEDMIKKEKIYQNEKNIDKLFWTTASVKGSSAMQFSNGINYKIISSVHNLLGLSIVMGTMSELTFFREAGRGDDYILRFFNDMKGRIKSRMKGNYWGRSILDSSPNDLESPIDHYCMFDAEKDPTNYIIKGSRWDWVPEDYKNINDRFPVFKGGNGKPPLILNSTEGYDSSDIIMVPREEYQLFHDDLVKSLKDVAGIPQGSLDKLFYDYEKIENCFVNQLKSVESCLHADARMPPYGLIWNIVKDTLFVKHGNAYRFYYKPGLPRTIHIDQSISGDMTGIAVCHVEKKTASFKGNNIDLAKDLIYVVDFVIPVHPFGGRINLDAVKEFVGDLITQGNMSIVKVTYDRFQSESAIQYLIRFGMDVEPLSVDTELDPYMFMAQLIEQGNLKIGRNLIFKNNLRSLRMVRRIKSETLKVDHTMGDTVEPNGADYNWESGLIGMNAKDVSDAVAGAIYSAKLNLSLNPMALKEVWNDDRIILSTQQIHEQTMDYIKGIGFSY